MTFGGRGRRVGKRSWERSWDTIISRPFNSSRPHNISRPAALTFWATWAKRPEMSVADIWRARQASRWEELEEELGWHLLAEARLSPSGDLVPGLLGYDPV